MAGPLLAVHPWPGSAHLLRAASQQQNGLIVIGVTTPMTTQRELSRQRIRIAVHEALVVLLALPPEAIQLLSVPGQPPQIKLPAFPAQRIGLSISHEPGLTLAAICLRGAIGIDLMRSEDHPDSQQDWQAVVRDYLGPQACARINGNPPAVRPLAFAQEWTRLEAVLKCHGQALTEWNPELEHRMLRCHMSELDLPAGLVGTVATHR